MLSGYILFRFVYEVQLDHGEAFEYCQAEDAKLIQTFPEAKRDVLRSLMRGCATSKQSLYPRKRSLAVGWLIDRSVCLSVGPAVCPYFAGIFNHNSEIGLVYHVEMCFVTT